MMKFTIKSLITLFVTGSALLFTPLSSYAQVNMKILTPVAKSCQEDAVSLNYYKQMGIDESELNQYSNSKVQLIQECIRGRYHYSLVLSKLPWLASTGEMLPGYPGSVAVGNIANNGGYALLVDCVATQNSSSQECNKLSFSNIAPGVKIRKLLSFLSSGNFNYYFYVCPSCVVAHDNIISREAILTAFIQWFIKLEKPKRRELMSILADDDRASQLRREMYNESGRAVDEYREARKRLEQQEKDGRRQELLGQ